MATNPRSEFDNSEFRGMGFSPDDTMLALSAFNNPGEGDVFYSWEIYSTKYGLEQFPVSPTWSDIKSPPMLRNMFEALALDGWFDNGKALAFKTAADSTYGYAKDHAARWSGYWITTPQKHHKYFAFPVVWSKQSTPLWFLDTVSRLIHIKQDLTRGMELVGNSKVSFQQQIQRVIREHRGDERGQNYIEFLQWFLDEEMHKPAGSSSRPQRNEINKPSIY